MSIRDQSLKEITIAKAIFKKTHLTKIAFQSLKPILNNPERTIDNICYLMEDNYKDLFCVLKIIFQELTTDIKYKRIDKIIDLLEAEIKRIEKLK